MKKKHLLIFPILAFLVTACIQDSLPNSQSLCRVVTVTAHIAEEQTIHNTKISLEQDDLNIKLEWEEGDVVDLCLVYTKEDGDVAKVFQQPTVTVDPENPKKATFSIEVPTDVVDEFDLYGLYGGGGLYASDYTKALLPDAQDALANDLKDIQNRKVMMLGFESLVINKNTTSLNATFHHLGSIFRILVKNTGSATLENITHAVLSPVGGLGATVPAYPNANRISLVDKTFTDAEDQEASKANSLIFTANTAFIVENGILAFWGWIPVEKGTGAGASWPALNLTLQQGGSDLITTTNPLPTRQATIGKTYHLFAEYDGTNLTFVRESPFTIPDGTVDGTNKGLLADTRDGNLYVTVKIEDQVWLAENLKYLPQLSDKSTYGTDKHYYVYNNDSYTEVKDGKDNEFYRKYGVLYNWAAVMDGSSTSNTVPSGVQGPCPPGWHVPSRAEWDVMLEYVRVNHSYDGNPGSDPGSDRTKIAKALATGLPTWKNDPGNKDGTPGKDDYEEVKNITGFSVLPGGRKVAGVAYEKQSEQAFFWSTYQVTNTEKAYRYRVSYDNPDVNRDNDIKTSAFSVRCLKDY